MIWVDCGFLIVVVILVFWLLEINCFLVEFFKFVNKGLMNFYDMLIFCFEMGNFN